MSSAEYDLHLYGAVPVDGMSTHVLGWSPPPGTNQELWKGTLYTSKCDGVEGVTDGHQGYCSHAREPGAGHRFLAVVMRFFNKNYHIGHAHPVVLKKEEEEGCSDVFENPDIVTLKCTLLDRKDEEVTISKDVSGLDSNSDVDESGPPPPNQPCPDLEGKNHSESSSEMEECPETEMNESRRVISFADDAGLPLVHVNVYDAPSDEEEGENGEVCFERTVEDIIKCARFRGFHSPARAKRCRRKQNGAKTHALSSPRLDCPEAPSYTRYYKPYIEDYETRNLHNTGAFSMIGF